MAMQQAAKSCPIEFIQIEAECSRFTPGASWVYGSEYYAIQYLVALPSLIASRDEENILDWCENHAWINKE